MSAHTPNRRAYLKGPGSMALLFVPLLLPLTSTPVAAQALPYTFYQIHPGFSPAMDVNDDGVVVGWWVGPEVAPGTNTNSRGYLWTLTTGTQPIITDAATVNNFPMYTAVNDPAASLRISASGAVAGVGCPQGCGTSGTMAAIWTPNQGLVFIGSFDNNLQTSAAAGINRVNQVVGFSRGGGYNNAGPFLWSIEDGLHHLTGFDGLNGFATGVNNNGVVVGAKGTGTRNVAFVWSSGAGQTDVPDVPGATTSIGAAVNDAGTVVGRYRQADQTTYRVFRWSAESGTEDLNAPAGFPELLDINNAGDIVATIIPPAGGGRVPYLYRSGTWTNVNDLLPSGTGFTIQYVTAINNKGWIAGAGTIAPPSELLQGFVLLPPNHPPVAMDDAISTTENTAVTGTLIASDVDGDVLTYSIADNGERGTALVTDSATGAFTYTPHAGSTGPDAFTFLANDGSSDSNTASIMVTIVPATGCATDISATVAVSSQGPLKLNRKTGRYTQTVTLRNGDAAAAAPVSLVIDGLSSNATLAGADGTTTCTSPTGSPYVNLDVGTDGVFAPRERTTVTLEFANPSGQGVSYTVRVLAGPNNR